MDLRIQCGRAMLVFFVFSTLLVSLAGQADTEVPISIPEGITIGIDLGTTYSVAGVIRYGYVEIIPNDQGNKITPSYVAFTPEGERLIGDGAKNQLTSNPTNTLFDIKRFIGREYWDPIVQKHLKKYPFKVTEQNGRPAFHVTTNRGPRTFLAEEISAMILLKMKESAEIYLGQTVPNAVITVPAYFNDAQRQATRDAGIIAGLNVVQILNEPTAAALAYGTENIFDQNFESASDQKTILVYDLGGGTLDVSLLSIRGGVYTVLATSGDPNLGGEDFDQKTVTYLIKTYKQQSGHDVSQNHKAIQKLRREAERVKRTLSTYTTARIEIDSLIPGVDFVTNLSRDQFENLNVDLFKAAMIPVHHVLEDVEMDMSSVDEILLVGGSTKIPMIRLMLENEFLKKPNFGMNADEAVGYGAAVQAAILSHVKSAPKVILRDVNPLTLGVELESGEMSVIIPRNTPIRSTVRMSDIFETVVDDQESVLIRIYEGERVMAADNHLLGEFELDGILPAPKGETKIKVTFQMDPNGILVVTADDLGRKAGEGSVTQIITNKHNRLSQAQIEKLILEAQKFTQDDKIKTQNLIARNELESFIWNLKGLIANEDENEFGGLLYPEEKDQLESMITEILQWMDENPKAGHLDSKRQLMRIETMVDRIIGRINASTGRLFIVNSTRHDHDEL